jgi:hypothetical protein
VTCGRPGWLLTGGGFNLMKPEARRCKCLHCKMLFVRDYRNRGRQKYCSIPECQRVSKRARQQRWLSKPENRDHFRGAENVQRVQEWRKAHPGSRVLEAGESVFFNLGKLLDTYNSTTSAEATRRAIRAMKTLRDHLELARFSWIEKLEQHFKLSIKALN